MIESKTLELIKHSIDESRQYVQCCIPPLPLDIQNSDVIEVSDFGKLVRKPLVSVLVITYNHENYIKECINSILSQKTSFDFEIIIGEDCSKDRTREILLSYQKEFPDKIRIVYSDRNVGFVENYKRISERARGVFIAQCEGDDYWLNVNRMQYQVDMLHGNSGLSLVHGSVRVQLDMYKWLTYGLRKCTVSERKRRCEGESQARDAIVAYSGNTATFMYRVALNNGVDEIRNAILKRVEWMPSGDFVRYFALAMQGKVGYLPEEIAVYRINKSSLTAHPDNVRAIRRMIGDDRTRLAIIEKFPEQFEDADAQSIIASINEKIEWLVLIGDNRTDLTRQQVKSKNKVLRMRKAWAFNRSVPYFLLRKIASLISR